jgi:hypothetical protein
MLDVNIQVKGINRLYFEKRELKAAIRLGGREVAKESRRLIANRAVSGASDFPGYDSGAMSRAIKVKVSSGGLYATVSPHKTQEMGDDYYPAYLIYGTKRGLEKRKDFVVSALDNKRSMVRMLIRRSLIKALRAV